MSLDTTDATTFYSHRTCRCGSTMSRIGSITPRYSWTCTVCGRTTR